MLATSALMACPAKERSFIKLISQQCVHLALKTHSFVLSKCRHENKTEESDVKFVQLPLLQPCHNRLVAHLCELTCLIRPQQLDILYQHHHHCLNGFLETATKWIINDACPSMYRECKRRNCVWLMQKRGIAENSNSLPSMIKKSTCQRQADKPFESLMHNTKKMSKCNLLRLTWDVPVHLLGDQ